VDRVVQVVVVVVQRVSLQVMQARTAIAMDAAPVAVARALKQALAQTPAWTLTTTVVAQVAVAQPVVTPIAAVAALRLVPAAAELLTQPRKSAGAVGAPALFVLTRPNCSR
jgi:hypothetical protein